MSEKTGWPYEGEAKPMNEQSEAIEALAAALSKAQGEIVGALKDANNPFFKSKYADLASCWDACRAQLSKNGLAVIQTTKCKDGQVFVVTTLAHSSGQWIRGELPVKAKDDGAQAQGSGITYARRYALAAIVGLAQIDDDAEAAQGRATHDNGHTAKPDFSRADPRGDAYKREDQNKALHTAEQVRGYISEARELDLYDLHEQLAKNADFYIAVADKLSASEKKIWKDVVHKIKKEKASAPMRADGRAA